MDHVTLKSGEIMQKIQLCLLKCIQIEKCIAVFFSSFFPIYLSIRDCFQKLMQFLFKKNILKMCTLNFNFFYGYTAYHI